MRITFVTPTLNMTGGVRVVSIYARLLARMGHEVCVASQAPGDSPVVGSKPSQAHPFFDPRDPLTHLLLPHDRAPVDTDLPDADVIIATWWETAEWICKLSRSKGVPVYFIQHHEVFPYLPVERVRATYRLPMHQIVIARWLADVMAQEYGRQDVTVVPNAVDHSLFDAAPRTKNRTPSIGFIYSRTPFKGTEIALRTLYRIRRALPACRIRAFGQDPLPLWHRLRLGIDYERDPAQQAIAQTYAAVDLWLSTSWSEGFNLPAMEAMSCRTPVVSTRTGWPAEAIRAGVNGALAEPGDVEALARACLDILGLDAQAWLGLSEGAYATAAAYQWEDCARRFEQALLRARSTALPAS